MSKILELIGFGLIGGTLYAWIGLADSPMRWPVFWSCAGGALAIILYRRIKKRR
jgi:hypothetical protein